MASTYTPIATTTLGSNTASYTFSSIPSTYTDLVLVVVGKSDGVNADFGFQFNGDTSSNYSRTYLYGSGSAASSGRTTSTTLMPIFNFSNVNTEVNRAFIQNYSNSTTYKTALSRVDDAASLGTVAQVGLWRSTSAIDSIKVLSLSSAVLTTGTSLTLYGILAA